MSDVRTIIGVVKEVVRESFEKTMHDEINLIAENAKNLIDKLAEEQKRQAKHMAHKMTIELLYQDNVNGIRVEFRL